MKTTKDIFRTLALVLVWSYSSGCQNENMENVTSECETTIDSSIASTGQELCNVTGQAQHFRIEGFRTQRDHSSGQLLMGFNTGDRLPTSQTDIFSEDQLSEDQLRLLFYHGGPIGPGMTLPPQTTAYFGSEDATATSVNQFASAATTLCFDVHDIAPPKLLLWVNGVADANCSDFSTLTESSAQLNQASWGSRAGRIADKRNYFYQSSGSTTRIVIYNSRAVN